MCRSTQGFRCGIGILEHPGIMDDADIKGFGNLLIQLFPINQIVYQFTCGAGFRYHIIHITAATVAHMVINVDFFICRAEILFRLAQTVRGSIQTEEHIEFLLFSVIAVDFLHTADTGKNIRRFFQENMDIRIRPYLL